MKQLTIGKKLRIARTAQDITQHGLAEAVGLTRHTILRYENEVRPPVGQTLADIEQFLNVKLSGDESYERAFRMIAGEPEAETEAA